MAHLPLVSIVIRSTDRQVFLAQALKSVEDQSYKNIEIVLVAACPDHTPAPLQIGAFPLHFIDSQSRVSRSDAANIGLKHCHGSHILILDDDDTIFPQHVEKLVSAFLEQKLKHPDLLAVFTDYEVVDGELQNPRPSGSPNYDPLKLLCSNFMTTNCVLFDRQVLDLGCAFDPSLDVFEDWDFWIQLSQYGLFKKVEGVSAYYRIHQSSGVHEIQAFFSHAHQLLYQKWLHGPHHTNFLKLIEFSWRSFVQIDQQKDDILSLKSDLARTQQQLDQWLIENKALQTYNSELLKTHQQHDQLLLDHEKLQAQYADLLQSHSWLITSPLRRFAYVFKRLLAISVKLPRLFKTQGIWKKYKSLVDRRALSWLMRLSSLSNKMSIGTWFSTLPWIKGYKRADHHSFAPYKVFKALRGSTENKSFALLVTYAPNGLISDTTVYYLQQLLKKSIHVVLCVHVDNEELEFKEEPKRKYKE
jgi:glycosyltransferase involved in cell wall biosynthesis